MRKAILLSVIILMISCKEEEIQVQELNLVANCSSLHQREDGQNSFYENNPTYQDINSAVTTWEQANFATASIDSSIFLLGEDILDNHPTLFSFLLIRNDKIVFEKYYNSSNANQSNNVHSTSKCIISALIGIAIEKGDIDGLNTPVLESFPLYRPNDALTQQIKIKHLLNMSSGLNWEEDVSEYIIEDEDNWTKAILDLQVLDTPGETFNYSTGNTHLLAAALQESIDVSSCDFMYTELMSPLGISVEHWGKDPQGYFSGGYNFYITPRELARFGLLYLNDGIFENKQLIPQDWVETTLSKQINVDEEYDYSYCWWVTKILGHDVFKAWGYGGQYICLIPSLDIMLVSTADTKDDAYDPLDIDSFILEYVIPAVE